MSEDEKAGLGPPPKLEPCPFCGKALSVKWRKHNPSARCNTEDCWGAKMPALQLDIPEYVAAWNTRPNSGPNSKYREFQGLGENQ